MTIVEALEIKIDFDMARRKAANEEKSLLETFSEPAKKHSKKHSVEELSEACKILQTQLDEEKEMLEAFFLLALESRINEEEATC